MFLIRTFCAGVLLLLPTVVPAQSKLATIQTLNKVVIAGNRLLRPRYSKRKRQSETGNIPEHFTLLWK